MRAFTDEEYCIMVKQLTDKKGASYEMLCLIAEKTLRRLVKYWCRNCGQPDSSDDLMQEIHERLIKTCVTKFLLRKEGKINGSPDEFNRWIHTVAHNTATTYLEKNGKYIERSRFVDGENEVFPDEYEQPDEKPGDQFEEYERKEDMRIIISCIFESAVSPDRKVYKTLTWLAYMLKMLEYKEDKSKVSASIDRDFRSMTLSDMYKMLLRSADRIRWLELSEAAKKTIETQLDDDFDGQRTYGEVKYSELYMKKGPVKTISDWLNRFDKAVVKKLGDEIEEALSL